MKKLVALLLVSFINSVFAQSASDEVQAKLNAIQTMTANFNQVVKAGKREVSNSYGVMALHRPGRFRWQTKSPLEQVIVADSKKLWVYDVDLEQVTVKIQQKGIGGTPALFLSGYDNTVARDFTVTKSGDDKAQIYNMHAKSSKENYQDVKLTFKGEVLTSLELFDQLGQRTMVRLSKIKTNPALSSKLFQFTPPKGVDVVKQ
ncbi:MAG: outer membrane lipoprotein chaperone LolA [Legionella sp.]|nr:outer membrane lipoprotein chaperone LolA [Legionella sp.]